jgi:hypothetical protein
MSIRSTLLTQLQTDLASGNISVSTELPYTSGSDTLNIKNMKTLYLDALEQELTEAYEFVNNSADIYQTESTINAFLSVDAKNQPADLDTRIASILSAKSAVANTITSESSVTSEIESDILTYTFTYRFVTI